MLTSWPWLLFEVQACEKLCLKNSWIIPEEQQVLLWPLHTTVNICTVEHAYIWAYECMHTHMPNLVPFLFQMLYLWLCISSPVLTLIILHLYRPLFQCLPTWAFLHFLSSFLYSHWPGSSLFSSSAVWGSSSHHDIWTLFTPSWSGRNGRQTLVSSQSWTVKYMLLEEISC